MIWALIGLVIGLAVGWYYGAWLPYALVGVVFGWLGGLMLGDPGEGGERHH